MSRSPRLLLAVALLAFGSLARGAELRLLAPAAGATLRGGAVAELRWDAAGMPPAVEEWEAFLSVNGGAYYAFRVTPHLDIALRRFTFAVPNVDTRDARILIRAGDEVRETHFELPGSFSIVRDPYAEPILPHLGESGHGEAAREGEPSVLAWTDGTRNGAGLTQRASTASRSVALHARMSMASHAETAELAPAITNVAAPSLAEATAFARTARARKPEPLPVAVDLLLVCRRRNI